MSTLKITIELDSNPDNRRDLDEAIELVEYLAGDHHVVSAHLHPGGDDIVEILRARDGEKHAAAINAEAAAALDAAVDAPVPTAPATVDQGAPAGATDLQK